MNRIAERFNRTLMDMTRTLLEESSLPQKMWAEAAQSSTYLINRLPHSKLGKRVPEDIFTGRKPNVKHLRRYGCLSFMYKSGPRGSKLSSRAKPGIFVGYAAKTVGYRIWFPYEGNKVVESKHITFAEERKGIESINNYREITPNFIYNTNWPEADNNPEGDEQMSEMSVGEHVEDPAPTRPESPAIDQVSCPEGWTRKVKTRSKGVSKGRQDIYFYAPDGTKCRSQADVQRYHMSRGLTFEPSNFGFKVNAGKNLEFHCLEIPLSFQEAIDSPESKLWKGAMDSEISTIRSREVFELVPKPDNKKVIGSRWLYDVKRNETGHITRFKARLVAQGFSQKYKEDYDQTYAPVINFTLIRMFLLVFIIAMGWTHKHLDVKCAYLYGQLQEEIYVAQPKGYNETGKENYVWRLRKALYGLKQSGRVWYTELDKVLQEIGCMRLEGCPCIYQYKVSALLLVYVDDIIILARNESVMNEISHFLHEKFQISDLGKVRYFLGVEFEFTPGELYIHQRKYIQLLRKQLTTQEDRGINKVPLLTGTMLAKNPSLYPKENSMYRQMIGSLQYLAHRTRPDIAFSVTTLARFANNPSRKHYDYVTHVLQYVCDTESYGLHYRLTGDINVIAYSDATWASDIDDRKSITGYIITMGGNPVVWRTVKQNVVALSSMESEYIALAETAKEVLWIKRILDECKRFGVRKLDIPYIHCDNQSAIKFSENRVENNRSKHIDLRYHFIRDCVEKNIFQIGFINSKNNVADVFTKLLPEAKFREFCLKLCLL